MNPALGVARALVDRGERVTCFLTPEFRASVERTGATFQGYETAMRPFRPPKADAPVAGVTTNGASAPPGAFTLGVLYEVFHVLPQVLAKARALRPDYVVYDAFCVWGRVLSRLLDVPAVALRPTYAVNERFSHAEFSDRAEATVSPDPRAPEVMQKLVKYLVAAYGVPASELELLSSYVEALNVVFLPRCFQPRLAAFDQRFLFVGPVVDERTFAPAIARPEGAGPLLFVSLGSVFGNQETDFYQGCMRAFEHSPWRVAIVVGQDIDAKTLEPLPANVSVHSGTYRLEVLGDTTVFLTHGGLCSVMEALSWGVPLVVVPHHPEHELTARRVLELGLGTRLSRAEASDPRRLREAIVAIAESEECRTRVRAMQRELRDGEGAPRAAEAILRFCASPGQHTGALSDRA